jgi:hypothetical protein
MHRKKFPEPWLIRLNEVAKAVRRQPGFGDIFAVVEPPRQPDHPPILRLELTGQVEIAPLSMQTVEHMMATGQQGPMLIEMKQAFTRLLKLVDRRARRALERPGRA